MRYFLAIILPPVAVWSTGRVFAGFINVILTCIYWIPGMIHALFVVNRYYADRRQKEMIDAIRDLKNPNVMYDLKDAKRIRKQLQTEMRAEKTEAPVKS